MCATDIVGRAHCGDTRKLRNFLYMTLRCIRCCCWSSQSKARKGRCRSKDRRSTRARRISALAACSIAVVPCLRTLLVLDCGSKSMTCSKGCEGQHRFACNDVASFGANDMACGPRRSDRCDTCCEGCGYAHNGHARRAYRAHLHILHASEPPPPGRQHQQLWHRITNRTRVLKLRLAGLHYWKARAMVALGPAGANQSDTDSA